MLPQHFTNACTKTNRPTTTDNIPVSSSQPTDTQVGTASTSQNKYQRPIATHLQVPTNYHGALVFYLYRNPSSSASLSLSPRPPSRNPGGCCDRPHPVALLSVLPSNLLTATCASTVHFEIFPPTPNPPPPPDLPAARKFHQISLLRQPSICPWPRNVSVLAVANLSGSSSFVLLRSAATSSP